MRRAFVAFVLVVAMVAAVYAVSTDNFTGTGALSGSWTVQQGDPTRDTDVAQGSDANENTAFNTAEAWGNDHYSQAVVAATDTGTNAGVTVRASGTAGSSVYYLLAAGARTANSGTLYSVSGTTYTLIVDWNVDFATNDVVKLQVVGTTLTGYKNGGSIGSTTNGTLATGSPGIYFFIGANTSLDNWEGATVAAAGACRGALSLLGVGGC